MLGYLRRRAGSLIIKFLFAIIIIVFVFFFGFDDVGDRKENAIASVGDTDIMLNQYQMSFKNMVEFYRNIYDENLTPEIIEQLGLKETVLENLIDREVLLQEARRMKISVGKEELRQSIVQDPLFQEDGFFSQRQYDFVLGYHGISTADYEKDKEAEIKLQKLQNMIKAGVTVSEKEVYDYFISNNEKARIVYAALTPEDIAFDGTVTPEDITLFYEENKEMFRKPETAQVSCLIFEPDFFMEKVQVDPEDVRMVYESEKYRFFEPMQVRARHILFKTGKEDDDERVQAQESNARSVLEKIDAGGSFEQLAQEFSDDTVTAEKGGDVGFFSSGEMVRAFEETAFSLQEGEVSGIVRSEFGFHIIKVEEIKPDRYKPLEQVEDSIVAELQMEKARDMAMRQSRRAFSRLFTSRDLEEYAQTEGMPLKTTDYFTYGGSEFDTLENKRFSQTAFSLAEGEIAPVFTIGQKHFLIRLDERRPSFIPPVEELTAEIEKEVLKKKRHNAARLLATDLISDISAGKMAWQDLALTEGVRLGETELKRTGEFISGIGRAPELKKEIFSLGMENTVLATPHEINRNVYIVKLLEKELPTDQMFEEEKKMVKQQLLSVKQKAVFNNFLDMLKKRTDITVNTRLFSSV